MKWLQSVFNIRLSRILLCLFLLGGVKLFLLWQGVFIPEKVEVGIHNSLSRERKAGTGPRVAHAQETEMVPDGQGDRFSREWQRLKEKEEELEQRKEDLKALEEEIDAKINKLNALEGRLKKMLEEAEEVKDQKLKHLVDVYSNMKPKQAAQVLETLRQDIAVKILAGMRGRKAGEILSYVNAKKAAILSAELTKVQMPFEK